MVLKDMSTIFNLCEFCASAVKVFISSAPQKKIQPSFLPTGRFVLAVKEV
jgi:hypothetical protein